MCAFLNQPKFCEPHNGFLGPSVYVTRAKIFPKRNVAMNCPASQGKTSVYLCPLENVALVAYHIYIFLYNLS